MFDHQEIMSTTARQRRIALSARAEQWRLLARFRASRKG
jgi:hypothetical protein